MIKNELFSDVIDDLDFGYWTLKDNISCWSSAFIKSLGYSEYEIEISLNYFTDHLIHKDSRKLFIDNFYGLVRNDIDFKQIVSVKCKDGSYKEFVCKSNEELPVNVHEGSKVIFFFERNFKTLDIVKDDNFYYRESAEMTSTGSWYVDFLEQKSYWDHETKRILEYPDNYIPSLKDSSLYYAEEHLQLAADSFFKCAMAGKAFDVEIKMLTANKREFWARAMGKPVYNDNKDIIGIRGVFQDIDDVKLKEINLQKTSDIVASQNSRLFNFAHIVSHNLRSHTSNLSLIVQLIEDVNTPEEKVELISSIKDISESLNSTIEHLNEVVTIQTQTSQNTVEVEFANTLSLVTKSIGTIVSENKAIVESNFSQVESIQYIPAYLESIILNLLTNAIKYKHPERDPIITLTTYIKDKKTFLEVTDNGIGIDLEKFGEKLFGMYKTFHYNKDAIGIGLFITKNQIESLNGEIFVDSKVGKGTTFTIQF